MPRGNGRGPYGTPQGIIAALLQALLEFWWFFLILVVVAFFLGWFARGMMGS